jgi:hypothetical protein
MSSSDNLPERVASPPSIDLEPDENWKSDLRTRIQVNIQSMITDARKSYHDSLDQISPTDDRRRMELHEQYAETMKNLKRLAKGQFDEALERERQERRLFHGQTISNEWSEALVKEQESIWASIQRDGGQGQDGRSSSLNHPAPSVLPPSAPVQTTTKLEPLAPPPPPSSTERERDRMRWTPQTASVPEHYSTDHLRRNSASQASAKSPSVSSS